MFSRILWGRINERDSEEKNRSSSKKKKILNNPEKKQKDLQNMKETARNKTEGFTSA